MKLPFAVLVILASLPGSGPDLADLFETHAFSARVIAGLPDSLLPEGCDSIAIVPLEPFMSEPVLFLAGMGPDTTLLGEVHFEGTYNSAKADWFFDPETGTVTGYSQMPSSAFTFTATYSVLSGPPYLSPVATGSIDPSAEAVEAARDLVDRGLLLQAADTLSGIFYPWRYFVPEEMSVAILARSHELALSFHSEGRTGSACSVMVAVTDANFALGVEADWFSSIPPEDEYLEGPFAEYLPFEDALEILNDYAFLLAEAGNPIPAEGLLRRVLALAPGRTVAYLNLADVLWVLGETEEARTRYGEYARMMDDAGLLRSVPERALERGGPL